MALYETYLSKINKIPKESRVLVMRKRGNDEIAPSEPLLFDFKGREQELKGQGIDPIQAHSQAWDDVDYERRFRKQILGNPAAIEKLRHLAKESKQKDIYLICFEKPPKKCHRFILLQLIKEITGKSP